MSDTDRASPTINGVLLCEADFHAMSEDTGRTIDAYAMRYNATIGAFEIWAVIDAVKGQGLVDRIGVGPVLVITARQSHASYRVHFDSILHIPAEVDCSEAPSALLEHVVLEKSRVEVFP